MKLKLGELFQFSISQTTLLTVLLQLAEKIDKKKASVALNCRFLDTTWVKNKVDMKTAKDHER